MPNRSEMSLDSLVGFLVRCRGYGKEHFALFAFSDLCQINRRNRFSVGVFLVRRIIRNERATVSEIEKSRIEMVRATSECKSSVDLLAAEVKGNLKALNRSSQDLLLRIIGSPDSPGMATKLAKVEEQMKHVWWLWSVIGAIALALLAEIVGWIKTS